MASSDATRLQEKFAKGQDLVAGGRIEEALRIFTAMAEDHPDLPELYPVLCELYLRAGRSGLPRSWITRAVRREPSFRDTFLEEARRAEVRFDALPMLHGLVEALPDDAECWAELGSCQSALNLHDEAEESFRRASALGGPPPA
jgi:tetratricopeptide (TPR) repeat protein